LLHSKIAVPPQPPLKVLPGPPFLLCTHILLSSSQMVWVLLSNLNWALPKSAVVVIAVAAAAGNSDSNRVAMLATATVDDGRLVRATGMHKTIVTAVVIITIMTTS